MFGEEQLAQIRERLPISVLVAEYVQLKKSGKNFKGLCPFHQERTPSFYVSDERETFHCFGCSTGGDLFEFLKLMESISFPEVVERLAERTGVSVEKGRPIDPKRQDAKNRHLEILRQAAWYYHCLLKKLPEDHEAIQYLKQRGLRAETIEQFFLGYCPPNDSGLLAHLESKGFKLEEMQTLQLFRGPREFFRGRLLFPIFRGDKKVVGFGGRKLSDKEHGPKYLNSSDSDIFKKGELFYGLDTARNSIRQSGLAIIVEGYFDVLSLHAHGITEAVAPLGTALTTQQSKALSRLTQEIILLFDSDDAGNKATLRALSVLLEQGQLPKRVELDAGEDPDSFLQRFGKLAFEKKLSARRNLLEELIDKWAAHAMKSPDPLAAKGQVAGQLMAMIEKIPDRITHNLYRRHLAEALEMPESWFQDHRSGGSARSMVPNVPLAQHDWLPEEETIIEVWLKWPPLRTKVRNLLEPIDFCTESAQLLAKSYWAQDEAGESSTGRYFDLAPPALIEVLRVLAIRSNGLEEVAEAEKYLEQATLRLKEKRLRRDLHALRRAAQPEQVLLIQEKINALSQLIKSKERIYAQGKDG